jgi:hypothetical protein
MNSNPEALWNKYLRILLGILMIVLSIAIPLIKEKDFELADIYSGIFFSIIGILMILSFWYYTKLQFIYRKHPFFWRYFLEVIFVTLLIFQHEFTIGNILEYSMLLWVSFLILREEMKTKSIEKK